jgi:hypothetical protein
MTSNVSHLQDKSLDYYDRYLSWKTTTSTDLSDLPSKRDLALLLVEQSHCYLNFYKYNQAKVCIKRALELLDLKIKLTGRLGRRTKYQDFDIAQLVLDVENREVKVLPKVETSEAPVALSEQAGEGDGEEEEEKNEQNVLLEEESILFETPQITDPRGDTAKKTGLTVEDQIAIQAYVNYVNKTTPKDESKTEMMRPYINAVVEKSNNWLVYSQGLLLRSRNEMDGSKTRERSVL